MCGTGHPQVAEIGYHAVLPKKRIVQPIARKIGLADHLPGIVERRGKSATAAEGAQIRQRSAVSKKWVVTAATRFGALGSFCTRERAHGQFN